MADAMLVTLTANPFISLTLPGKVQSYMAAGKPIIAAANGEIQHIIADSGCGYCAAAEDAQGLADAVSLFLKCENRTALGSNARRYYKENFTREKFMDNMESALHAACELEG
jgi:glycosyltransferase involved in cell wall biosynthesis